MENKEYSVRNMLFLEDDRKKAIKIGTDTFIIKAIFPEDEVVIARKTSILQNGLPANSFHEASLVLFDKIATVDQMVATKPGWFKSAMECPDRALVDELYNNIHEWSNEFQDSLKKNKLGNRGGKS